VLRTDAERNEQRGLANILKGIFSAFRNPAAHEPRIVWHVRAQDALDLLTMISLVHRRLDEAQIRRGIGAAGRAPSGHITEAPAPARPRINHCG
jgi:Protein of unknown function (Hypoth_ymh)